MRISKKITALFIAVMMVVSAIPFTASAASEPYLTFTGTDSFSIKTNNNAKNWSGTLEYSTDTNTWTTWDGTQISSDNDVLYLRGTGNTQITGSGSSSKYWVITTEGTVACSGDIRTLLDYTDPESSSMGNYCFAYLFKNWTSLTAAPALPATILAYNCYNNMFRGCTSLTTAPELPATNLAQECYAYMFNGCTSLTMAPELPATTLERNCYQNMFSGCTSLTTAPALPALTAERYCYYYMFEGCTSLTTAPELPATTLVEYCYQNMFNGCESLTTAPALPATTLSSYCYDNMFYGCTSLTTAPQLPATTLNYNCYSNMFYGCTSLTTAPALPATTLASNCYRSMFQGCTSLTTAPALPATTLGSRCYDNMFNGCTSLTTPSELPATTLTSFCYNGMFQGCTGIKLSTTQTAEYSIPYSIPKQGTAESVGNYALTDMFTGTGGTFTGTPSINITYYLPAPAPAVNYVAEINGTGYETLEEAIEAAQDGDTITLLDDVTGNFTIPAGKNVSLDLNDHTITATSTSTPVITNRGTLNVYGGTIVNNGLYFPDFLGDGGVAVMNYGVATVNVTTNKGAIVNRSTSSTTPNLTVAGGTYAGNPLALSSENNSYTVINGGNFTGQASFVRANSGATTEVNDGNFACLGTESESNWIVNGGNVNAITVDGTTKDISITVTGGEIKELPATSAVSEATNVSVEVSGGSFNSVVPEEYCATGYVPVTEPNEQGKYEVKQVREDGFNLSIEDMIHMNLYINVDDYTDPATATVTVTYNDPEKQTPTLKVDTYSGAALAALKDEDDGRYVIPVLAAPAQMRDNVSVTVTGRDDSVTTSVAKYCETIIATSNDAKLVALAKAMLDYGKACSAEFNYNVDGFEEQAYYNTDDVSQYIEAYSLLNSESANGKFKSYAYIAKSVPALRIYLNTTEAEAVALGGKAIVDGEETQIMVDPDGNVCVDITGILAENLNAEYTVEFNGGELKLNALQFAKAKGGNTDLGRSMYNYYTAADAYFV